MLFEPTASRRNLGWQPCWFVLWLVVTGFGLALHPDPSGHGTHQELGLPPCPSVLLFDRPCPGCGLTTSWTALLHGQIGAAFSAHPLGPILYLLFTISALLAFYGFLKVQKLVLDSRPMSRFLMVTTLVFVGFGFIRMALTPHFRSTHEQELVSRMSTAP